MKTQRQEEEEEEAIVASPNAVVHPGTVMVKVLKRLREHAQKKPQGITYILLLYSLFFKPNDFNQTDRQKDEWTDGRTDR